MEKFIIIFTVLFFCSVAIASNYSVYDSSTYTHKNTDEKILFIIDYSSSMDEYLDDFSKFNAVLRTMGKILPKLSPDTQAGLRIYGHRAGVTAYDACRASTLVVPVMPASSKKIEAELYKHKPRGMTPITYSLQQAVNNDLKFDGKKRIILLTDGGENCGESPCKWAINLIQTRKDINIDVIAFNVEDDDDLDQLKCTSSVTSGKFYNPKTSAELVKSFENSLNITKEVEAEIVNKK